MVITLSVVPRATTALYICCFCAVVCSELTGGRLTLSLAALGECFSWFSFPRKALFFSCVSPDFYFFSCPGMLFSSLVMFFCFPLYFTFALPVGPLELCEG